MTLSFLWSSFKVSQPLHHIRHGISRKPLEIEASFQRTTNKKLTTKNRMITLPMTSRDQKGQVVIPIPLKPNISKTTGDAI